MNTKLLIAITVHTAAIVAANWMTATLGLIPIGFGLVVTAGTFAAGFALLARDFVHRYGGIWWAFVGILLGAVISWFMSTPALAVASAVAFGAAELVDLLVFTPLRKHGFIRAAVVSNIVSAPIDTVLFLAIAGFPITWEAVLGQFVGKVILATLIPIALYAAAREVKHGDPVLG